MASPGMDIVMSPAYPSLVPSPENPSQYFFSAAAVPEHSRPTRIKCVPPSPPRRVRNPMLSIVRIFKRRPISTQAQKAKSVLKRKDAPLPVHAPDEQPVAGPSGSQSFHEHHAESSASQDEGAVTFSTASSDNGPPSHIMRTSRESSPLDSPLSTPSSSPPSTPSSTSTSTAAAGTDTDSNRRPAPARRLMRSTSRSSIQNQGRKRPTKINLNPNGGITTRYGVRDGEPIFIRETRNSSTTEPDVSTTFWETFSAQPIRSPPDLTRYPDLTVGDVYSHVILSESCEVADAVDVQLWHWTSNSDGQHLWKRAREGDVRGDGRRLIVTPKRKEPSWVSAGWGVKQLVQVSKRNV
ncbi:hypothetical protein OH76DRAFT_1490748 [Lentinus brumalis]|uniref:Uncharacterized protein n=1 Tax=Lentinus brumalis TaxID=2498619 RepID=A0A371CI10_9APHY|nr:hypothetical protein OH76DRAFT_1490748 [Polyporus brumalis]